MAHLGELREEILPTCEFAKEPDDVLLGLLLGHALLLGRSHGVSKFIRLELREG